MSLPRVTGIIGFTNAVEAAGGAVDSLMHPWNMGNMGLEWVLAVMDGAPKVRSAP